MYETLPFLRHVSLQHEVLGLEMSALPTLGRNEHETCLRMTFCELYASPL